jgi:cell division protein FtsL
VVSQERDPGAFLRLALLLLCGLALAGGFVYAGDQHFAALKLGYQTEDLRKVREGLAEEQRRFLLEREAAASPARLERAARQLGMQPIQAAQIDPLKRAIKSSTENDAPDVSSAVSPNKASATGSAQTRLIRLPTSGRTGPAINKSDSARTR